MRLKLDKPQFVPMKKKYYEAFLSGEVRSELRLYGPRWNERTCAIGRPVVLSCGYGKQRRQTGVIRAFYRRRGNTFGSTYQRHIRECYGTVHIWIAEIRIDLDERSPLGEACNCRAVKAGDAPTE